MKFLVSISLAKWIGYSARKEKKKIHTRTCPHLALSLISFFFMFAMIDYICLRRCSTKYCNTNFFIFVMNIKLLSRYCSFCFLILQYPTHCIWMITNLTMPEFCDINEAAQSNHKLCFDNEEVNLRKWNSIGLWGSQN